MDREEMLIRLKKGEEPLEIAIQKWQDIVDGTGSNEDSYNCALCEVHLELEGCQACPVGEKTGLDGCDGSPYTDYSTACVKRANPQKLTKLAKEELEFLKSLRKEAT